jgi:hypothetical protein
MWGMALVQKLSSQVLHPKPVGGIEEGEEGEERKEMNSRNYNWINWEILLDWMETRTAEERLTQMLPLEKVLLGKLRLGFGERQG